MRVAYLTTERRLLTALFSVVTPNKKRSVCESRCSGRRRSSVLHIETEPSRSLQFTPFQSTRKSTWRGKFRRLLRLLPAVLTVVVVVLAVLCRALRQVEVGRSEVILQSRENTRLPHVNWFKPSTREFPYFPAVINTSSVNVAHRKSLRNTKLRHDDAALGLV